MKRKRLYHDEARCIGAFEGRVCERAETCLRHLALRTDPQGAYISQAAWLCHSSWQFYIQNPTPLVLGNAIGGEV